jgi:hypothetical protein
MFHSRMNRMPKSFVFILLGIISLVAAAMPQPAAAYPRGHWSVGLNINRGDYDYLSEYGEWVNTPEYGMVWMPYVIEDWRPFFHGHWSWTYDGWAWISYEPFGWLVFHYGYWYYDPYYGWFWEPGRIWSPARVEWYTYGNYCAWAPLPPPHHYWRNPWDYPDHNVWIMVDVNHFTDDYVGHHQIHQPFRGEKHHPGAWMKEPPSHRHVEQVTQRALPPVRISRERVDLRSDAERVPTKYYRPKETVRKKMVLPEREADKVREHRTTVEREVLVPREKAPRRDTQPQRAPEQRQQQQQKDKQKQTQQQEERQQKTIKRR